MKNINNEYLNILVDMAQAKKERLDAIQHQENSTISGKDFFIICRYGIPVSAILLLTSVLINHYFKNCKWLTIIGLLALLVLYLCGLSYPFFDLWNRRIKIKSFLFSFLSFISIRYKYFFKNQSPLPTKADNSSRDNSRVRNF
jgi:hypothetical protein